MPQSSVSKQEDRTGHFGTLADMSGARSGALSVHLSGLAAVPPDLADKTGPARQRVADLLTHVRNSFPEVRSGWPHATRNGGARNGCRVLHNSAELSS